jgi:hypothetical protein
VRILPPKPRLYQSKIVDFDASAAMRVTIPGTYGVPIAEKTGETAFCCDFFEPEVSKTDVEGQKKRWAQFGMTWNSAPATAALVQATPSTAPMRL